jgi:hypothetical protein
MAINTKPHLSISEVGFLVSIIPVLPYPNIKGKIILSKLTLMKLLVKDFRVLRMIAKFYKTISFQLY